MPPANKNTGSEKKQWKLRTQEKKRAIISRAMTEPPQLRRQAYQQKRCSKLLYMRRRRQFFSAGRQPPSILHHLELGMAMRARCSDLSPPPKATKTRLPPAVSRLPHPRYRLLVFIAKPKTVATLPASFHAKPTYNGDSITVLRLLARGFAGCPLSRTLPRDFISCLATS